MQSERHQNHVAKAGVSVISWVSVPGLRDAPTLLELCEGLSLTLGFCQSSLLQVDHGRCSLGIIMFHVFDQSTYTTHVI